MRYCVYDIHIYYIIYYYIIIKKRKNYGKAEKQGQKKLFFPSNSI